MLATIPAIQLFIDKEWTMTSRHLTAKIASHHPSSTSIINFRNIWGWLVAPIEVGGILFLCQLVSAMSFDGTQVCGVGKLACRWANFQNPSEFSMRFRVNSSTLQVAEVAQRRFYIKFHETWYWLLRCHRSRRLFFLTGNYSFCWFKNGWIILDAELVGSPAQEFVNIDFVTVDIDEAEAALG